jgi:CRISPR-associated exonuclease Cas4
MVTEGWLLVAVCIACGGVAWITARVARKRPVRADVWIPGELKDEVLAYSERTFRSGGDRPVVARVDRAYRGHGGVITLVELKTRPTGRVHPSDIIELSAQRVALAGETGEPVAVTGWVVVQTEAARTAYRVRLMSPLAIQRLALRRGALLDGKAQPTYPATTALCASCAYRNRCHPRS